MKIVDLSLKLDVVPELRAPAVLRCEVRNEFHDLVSPVGDLFAQENAVMVQVERDAAGAIRWDEGLLADPGLLGPYGISHYLLDRERLGLVLESVRRHPPMDAATRERIIAESRL